MITNHIGRSGPHLSIKGSLAFMATQQTPRHKPRLHCFFPKIYKSFQHSSQSNCYSHFPQFRDAAATREARGNACVPTAGGCDEQTVARNHCVCARAQATGRERGCRGCRVAE